MSSLVLPLTEDQGDIALLKVVNDKFSLEAQVHKCTISIDY